MDLVSTLILANARPGTLPRALESALAQDYPYQEIIVVQDSDDSEVREVVQRYERRDARVKHFQNPKPGSIAQASNYGVAVSSGKYVAVLDDDDSWTTPAKLSLQVSFLAAHAAVVGVGGHVIVVGEGTTELTRYRKPIEDHAIRRVALRANPLANSASMFRRKTWERVGGYDESLPAFHDWDFWLKAGKQGELANVDRYLLQYQLWQEGSSWRRLRANAKASREIVRRHRSDYSGADLATVLSWLYTLYAYVPPSVTSRLYPALSAAKKRWLSR
ncbi:MAG TPA: glycosyltransferase family A protein [Opitutaceae bacterium]|nr:glycosyltransferase family A protein [Lacunisphaera sp.]HWA09192.1 glycosyltransferase family A protein [Opitutaceae bacterium]